MNEEYQTIESAITALLSTDDGAKKLESRRRAICGVAEVAKDINKWGWADKTWRLCKRPGIWFSTTQGQAAQADTDGCVLSVQMLGREIGKLKIDRSVESASRYVFIPCKKYKPHSKQWDWSKNPEDGEEIRMFLKALKETQKWDVKKVQEREIQWQLAEQLDKVTKDHFQNLRTVRWVGCPTEIGVSLTAAGNLGKKSGTIDLLVRRLGGQGAQFLVFEVKRPGEKDVESTLRQAIYYALALHIEANPDGTTQKSYRTAFGSKGDTKLLFGAVIVMEDNESKSNRENGEKVLTRFKPRIENNRIVDRVGMLLYKWDDKNTKAHSWTWLQGWDPRMKS